VRDPGGKSPTAPVPSALPLPDKPSIAVLPFANMSGDPDQEYFADGMVDAVNGSQTPKSDSGVLYPGMVPLCIPIQRVRSASPFEQHKPNLTR
jgi:hypothetical protein